jgi:hypothetical protein
MDVSFSDTDTPVTQSLSGELLVEADSEGGVEDVMIFTEDDRIVGISLDAIEKILGKSLEKSEFSRHSGKQVRLHVDGAGTLRDITALPSLEGKENAVLAGITFGPSLLRRSRTREPLKNTQGRQG